VASGVPRRKPAKGQFVKIARKREHGAEQRCRIAPQDDGNRHRLTLIAVQFGVPGSAAPLFPLDGDVTLTADLNPVHPAILRAAIRIGGENLRQGDVP